MKMVEGVIAENADFQTSTSTSELEDCTGEVKKLHMQVQRCNQSGCQCFETNVADAMKNGTDARKMCQPPILCPAAFRLTSINFNRFGPGALMLRYQLD